MSIHAFVDRKYTGKKKSIIDPIITLMRKPKSPSITRKTNEY